MNLLSQQFFLFIVLRERERERERGDGRERERNINLLFHLFLHSLVAAFIV